MARRFSPRPHRHVARTSAAATLAVVVLLGCSRAPHTPEGAVASASALPRPANSEAQHAVTSSPAEASPATPAATNPPGMPLGAVARKGVRMARTGSGRAPARDALAPAKRAAAPQREAVEIAAADAYGGHAVVRAQDPLRGFDTESYAHIADNPFLAVANQPVSTFSVDVDTASYSNARRFLSQGGLPPKDSIRVEEWLNYFRYEYAEPRGDAPFAVDAQVTSCPWNDAHRLVRLGIQGATIREENVPPRNLVFLLDVSGSMMSSDKLPLVKSGLALLTETLRPQDSIAIAVYAGSSGLVLPPTSGSRRGTILKALEGLEAGGSTNGGEGIRLAYSIAQQQFRAGINRVILATDGDFNVGTTSEGELQRLIEEKRKSGVFLTVLGFGTGNVKDSTMELLADKGNGNYAYIDSLREAHKVLVREAGSTLVTIAKDVKLQVEFNPRRVSSYKLIGYENRLLAREDFNDDTKDAGEIGAGHTVTALYEIVPASAEAHATSPKLPSVEPLKYQTSGAPSQAAAAAELLTVNIRYKRPESAVSTKLSLTVPDATIAVERASHDARFAIAVANVALLLRGSTHVKQSSLATARALAESGLGSDVHGDRREFLSLVDAARRASEPVVFSARP